MRRLFSSRRVRHIAADITPLIDVAYYSKMSPSFRTSSLSIAEHFNQVGSPNGLQPNAFFDPAWYLASYPDVATNPVEALRHYARFGWKERRDPSIWFSTLAYLIANSDVEKAGINPLQHYLEAGSREGRKIYSIEEAASIFEPLRKSLISPETLKISLINVNPSRLEYEQNRSLIAEFRGSMTGLIGLQRGSRLTPNT